MKKLIITAFIAIVSMFAIPVQSFAGNPVNSKTSSSTATDDYDASQSPTDKTITSSPTERANKSKNADTKSIQSVGGGVYISAGAIILIVILIIILL